ncbi:MAG: urease accessory protein UreE [Burkholderiales bacterium]|nr:urease accessory protein UreE [Burkholderiales bacterium]
MLTVNKLIPRGRGLAAALLKRAPEIALDWDTRSKSRFEATDSSGRRIGVFLARGSIVRGGDVLLGEDGSMLRAVAAPQPVLVVSACSEHGTPVDLARAAYHLGNRHVAVEVAPGHLKIEPDPVLAQMLRRMHLTVAEASEAFEPEGGAYQSEPGHAHHDHEGHGHGSGHAQAHGEDQGHAHDHDHDHGHDHAHDHGHKSR